MDLSLHVMAEYMDTRATYAEVEGGADVCRVVVEESFAATNNQQAHKTPAVLFLHVVLRPFFSCFRSWIYPQGLPAGLLSKMSSGGAGRSNSCLSNEHYQTSGLYFEFLSFLISDCFVRGMIGPPLSLVSHLSMGSTTTPRGHTSPTCSTTRRWRPL